MKGKYGKWALILSSALLLFNTGCSSSASTTPASNGDKTETKAETKTANNNETYTIKIGHVLDENYHYQKGAMKFKEIVEEKSGGRITVEIFPNSQLGDERQMIEGMRMGTIEMGIISSGPVSGFVPEFSLMDLGYLFDSNETAQKVLNGPIGDQLNEKMVASGFRNLAFLDMGFRNVYGNKPIKTVEDLSGVKIRTLETPAQLDLFTELGASPMPMGYSELYTSLQQGVIDAAENVPSAFYSSKHYEIAKDYSLTKHFYLIMMYLVSENFYQSLPEDLRKIVTDAAAEAATYENGIIVKEDQEVIQQLKEKGVTITEIDDLTPFIDVAKKSWTKTAEAVPNGQALLDEILKQTAK